METQDTQLRKNSMSLLVNEGEEEPNTRVSNAGVEPWISISPNNDFRSNNDVAPSNGQIERRLVPNNLPSLVAQQHDNPQLDARMNFGTHVINSCRIHAPPAGQQLHAMGLSGEIGTYPVKSFEKDQRQFVAEGRGFENSGGTGLPQVPDVTRGGSIASDMRPRFVPPPSNHSPVTVPTPAMPLERCYVSHDYATSRLTNIATSNNIRSAVVPPVILESSQLQGRSFPRETPIAPEKMFDSLVQSMLNHPTFPLILSGVCKTCTGKEPMIENKRMEAKYKEVAQKTEQTEQMLRELGLRNAQSHMDGVQLFLTAMTAAFKSLQSDVQPPIPAPLHEMINACSRMDDRMLPNFTIAGSTSLSNGGSVRSPNHRNVKLDYSAREALEKWFNDNYESPYPNAEQKNTLANLTGLSLHQINNYFGNKRMRLKRKVLNSANKEQELKTPITKNTKKKRTVADSILAPRSKWRNIVLSQRNVSKPEDKEGIDQNDARETVVSDLFPENENPRHPDVVDKNE